MGTFVDVFFSVQLLLELIRVLAFALEALDVAAWLLDVLVFVAGAIFTGALEWLVGEYGMKPLLSRRGRTVPCEDGRDTAHEIERLQREVGRLEGKESLLREQFERERRKNERLEIELREARRPWWRWMSRR